MKKAKILSSVLLLCFSSPLISQAATLDVRGGYRSGSHAYETRLKVSEGWQNGWWASMESNTWNTIHDNKKENAALNDVQVEVNYAIKLDDQWTVGNDSNLLIVFYVQIMPDDFVMQLHRF